MIELNSIKKRMSALKTELDLLQAKCRHNNIDKQYKANTGNWCKDDDEYWIEFHCHDCDKKWSIPQ